MNATSPKTMPLLFAGVLAILAWNFPALADGVPGEFVRLTRGEMLIFEGKNLVGAPKGQEFTLLKLDPALKRVFVSFLKDDGTLVAVTLPDDAIEPSPDTASRDLSRGMEAFRDRRYEESRRLLLRASQDKECGALASALAKRLETAYAAAAQARVGTPAGRPAFGTALQGLRETAEQLNSAGGVTFALCVDEGTDRLGGDASSSKLDRADLAKRAAVSQRSVMRARQDIALKRLNSALKAITEGLQAEPGHLELKAFQPRVQRDIGGKRPRARAAEAAGRRAGATGHNCAWRV